MEEILKELKLKAMKAGDTFAIGTYSIVLGEIQLATSKKTLTEDKIVKIVRDYRDSCHSNFVEFGMKDCETEVALLDAVLPALPVMISRDALASYIRIIIASGNLDSMKDNVGRCTGEVCRQLKIEEINAKGADVRSLLEEMLK